MTHSAAATTETGALIEFVTETRFRDLPAQVVRQAARCALDSIGCAIAGAETHLAAGVVRLVRSAGGTEEASLLGPGGRVPASAAALANGTAANALDFDDTLLGHPGSSVVSAALALAEAGRRSGEELLTALVVGYELCGRIVGALEPIGGRFTRIWDTATLQTFGAVAAAASLLHLTAAETQSAFGIAAATAPLVRVRKSAAGPTHRPMFKSAWGWSAEAGVRAARLAADGLTAQSNTFDGDLGLWQLARAPGLGLRGLTDRIGESYMIEQVEFKPYPCCRFIHPVLDALRAALAGSALIAADVDSVRIATFSLLGDPYHSSIPPATVSDAQFSTPFCVAAFLVDGGLRPHRFTPERIRDPAVAALAELVRVQLDEGFEAAFPQRFGAEVCVRTRAGRELMGAVVHPRGGPDRPLPNEELAEKFTALVAARLGGATKTTVRRLLALEQEADVRIFMDEVMYAGRR